jgi:thiosulfate dehydrogenase
MKRSRLLSLVVMLGALTLGASTAGTGAEGVDVDLTTWTPPDIASVADDSIGRMVKYGYLLFTDTENQIGPRVANPAKRFAGNNLACKSCHLEAGTQPYAVPMTGAWGQFPQYRAREGSVVAIETRINGCMERSMNGRALPLASREMVAFAAYIRWLSTGIPDGAKLRGAGTLRIAAPARAGNPAQGAQIYAQTCAVCHGADGQGLRAQTGLGYQFPPLWGPDSFNDGAGMNRLLTAAAYVMHAMPLGTRYDAPVLTADQAYDVVSYILSRKRPAMANLDKDFPVRLQKPIDAPYGPYVDGFSAAQHRYGPFGPIRLKLEELAAAGGITKADGADIGSDESGRPK